MGDEAGKVSGVAGGSSLLPDDAGVGVAGPGADAQEAPLWGGSSQAFAEGGPTLTEEESVAKLLSDKSRPSPPAPTPVAPTDSPPRPARPLVHRPMGQPAESHPPRPAPRPAVPPPVTGPTGPSPDATWLYRPAAHEADGKRPALTHRGVDPAPPAGRTVRRRPLPIPRLSRWRLPHPAPDGVVIPALALAIASRLVLAGMMWFSLRIIPRRDRYPGQLPDSFFPDHPALDGWARWDAAHYVAVASLGYGDPRSPSPDGGVGFFPLFPLLMRGAVEVVGATPTPARLALAGIILANLSFVLAVPLLARLAAARFGPAAGRNAAVLLCVAPLSFFFNAAYSESLFLLLVVTGLTLAGRGRWWWAGTVAGLASGTRLVGLALAPALLFLAWRRRAPLRELAGVALLSPLGALAYFAYSAWKFDNPFAYFEAQATWGGWNEHVRFYAELFVRQPREVLAEPRHLIIVLNLALAAVFLAFVPRLWRELDPGIALFSTLLIVVQAAFTWVSLGRYLLPAVGVYLVAGALLASPRWSGWPRDAVIVTSTLLLGLLALLYGHGFWVV